MKLKSSLALATLLCAGSGYANAADKSCLVLSCAPGQHVVVMASKDDPAALCPTDALSAFSNFVLELVAMRSSMGVASPSDPDDLLATQEGSTAALIQKLKNKAGVTTAREAFAACQPAKHGVKAVVLEVDQQSTQAKIAPQNSNVPVWLPAGSIDKI